MYVSMFHVSRQKLQSIGCELTNDVMKKFSVFPIWAEPVCLRKSDNVSLIFLVLSFTLKDNYMVQTGRYFLDIRHGSPRAKEKTFKNRCSERA